jgi:plastocyanin
MNRNLLLGLFAVVIVGVLAWWYFNSPRTTTTTSTTSTPSGQTNTVTEKKTTAATQATITFNGSGFSPSTVTVASGAKITVVNSSTQTIDFASNPHPLHTDNPELNIGTIAPGGSKTFTVTRVGTWGYHDHLNAIYGGTIIVQ